MYIAFGGDHPRTRGVYPYYNKLYLSEKGSSPHTRGLRYDGGNVMVQVRIIPAHAGFTDVLRWSELEVTDHPRTRGVYATRTVFLAFSIGSSPHTRGLRLDLFKIRRCRRIIPAHAGFTGCFYCGFPSRADHPRTRGVYPAPVGDFSHHTGSSPHTRGLRGRVIGVTRPGRIIPAHAGFTSVPCSS